MHSAANQPAHWPPLLHPPHNHHSTPPRQLWQAQRSPQQQQWHFTLIFFSFFFLFLLDSLKVYLEMKMPLPRLPTVAELLQTFNVRAIKQLSQNFLLDANLAGGLWPFWPCSVVLSLDSISPATQPGV